MEVAIDAQLIVDGNRSGLYNHLRCLVRELRPILNERVWLIADASGRGMRSRWSKAATVAAAMDGITVRLIRSSSASDSLWHRFSAFNRADVLLHNLHGRLPLATRGANAYLVPDVIPLAIDYGPGCADRYRPFYEAAVRHGDVILVFSEHGKRDLVERVGADPEVIRVAPLAAGPEFQPVWDGAQLRAALRSQGLEDTPYVLMVATLEIRKNHAVLLRAFARLLQRDPSLPHKLVLVGGKWVGHEAVFDLIGELRLRDRVRYLGFVDQLAPLYGGAHAFVFPSRYEGFGLPPLEAMASGVPVLVAAATSLPEVVADAGVLFQPDDDVALCEALHRVLTDSSHHADLVARGLARAQTFSWRRTAELYKNAFEFGIRRFRDGTPRH